MATSKIQTGLRLSETLYGKIKTLSLRENRSMNNLMEHVLQKYVEKVEAESGVIPQADSETT